MAKVLKTTDPIHPTRLLVSAALTPAEFSKKFRPNITNTPALPPVNWAAIGQAAPQLLATSSKIPSADALVIIWADQEWAAMQQVFCGTTSMPYSRRNESSWGGWIKYNDGVPRNLGYWGYYRLVQVNGAKVLLF